MTESSDAFDMSKESIMVKKKVILYTQPGWHFCSLQKAWLSEQDVEFEERNIQEDSSALEELKELGIFSTPATRIDDELVIGFNQQKLVALLGL